MNIKDKLQFVRNKGHEDQACSIIPANKFRNENVALIHQYSRDLTSAGLQFPQSHTARCPGLNQLSVTGWIVLMGGQPLEPWPPEMYTRFFPEWHNKYLYKIPMNWMIYVPDEKQLLTIPVQNNSSDDWFAVQGIIKKEYGPSSFSIFVLSSNRNLTIEPGTPIAQLIAFNKDNTEADFREENEGDAKNFVKKWEIISKSKNSLRELRYADWENVD